MEAINESAQVHLVDHPFAAAQLSILRARETAPNEFRNAMHKLAVLLLIQAARAWEVREVEMQSPLQSFRGTVISRPVIFVPILRAGLGLQAGMSQLIPEASTGHIGLYRDPQTLRPVKYYSCLPNQLVDAQVLVLDPMLATGYSAIEAISIVKAAGATRVQFVGVLACPTGIRQLQRVHPEVPIIIAALDPELNAAGYIVPGLGDAGDRYFGTGAA